MDGIESSYYELSGIKLSDGTDDRVNYYIAFLRSDRWFLTDDKIVREVQESMALNQTNRSLFLYKKNIEKTNRGTKNV